LRYVVAWHWHERKAKRSSLVIPADPKKRSPCLIIIIIIIIIASSPWAKKYSLPLMPIVDPDDTRPTSLLECQDDNWEMDDERFRLFQEREDDEKENVMINMVSMIARLQSSIDDDSDEGEQEPVAKKRRKSKREVMYTDADGTKHPLETRETWWYSALCRQP
jgi:hypothetical protein